MLGDLTINSGVLEIELGGTVAHTGFDQVMVTGNAILAGTLDVSLIDGFALGGNDVFEILDVGGTLTGQFSGLGEGARVGNFGRDLFITYVGGDGNDVALYTTERPGDFNSDGLVDGSDFLMWQSNPLVGSLSDWEANYGQPLSASAAAVPEPGPVVLLAIALVCWIYPGVRHNPCWQRLTDH